MMNAVLFLAAENCQLLVLGSLICNCAAGLLWFVHRDIIVLH
jgi:hypothetical protein